MTKTKAKQPSPYGTWYTDAGERADAWPAETTATSQAAARQHDTLVASSVHAMAGAGGGLMSRVSRLLGAFTTAPICRLL